MRGREVECRSDEGEGGREVRVLCWFQRKRKLRELKDKLAASEQKKASLEQQVKAAKIGREDSVSDDVEITAHIVYSDVTDTHNVCRMSE